MASPSLYGANTYGTRPYSYEPLTPVAAVSTVSFISVSSMDRVRDILAAVSVIHINSTMESWPERPPYNPGWSGSPSSDGVWTPIEPNTWR